MEKNLTEKNLTEKNLTEDCSHQWRDSNGIQICADCSVTRKKPMTQQDVENYILLKGQSGERWFKLMFVDEEMNHDPTAIALMDSIGNIIQAGIVTMALEESLNTPPPEDVAIKQ